MTFGRCIHILLPAMMAVALSGCGVTLERAKIDVSHQGAVELDFKLTVSDDREQVRNTEAERQRKIVELKQRLAQAQIQGPNGYYSGFDQSFADNAASMGNMSNTVAPPSYDTYVADLVRQINELENTQPGVDNGAKFRTMIENCRGVVRSYDSAQDGVVNIAAHFSLSGAYEFDQIMECMGQGGDDRPTLAWSKRDDTFKTIYLLTFAISGEFGASIKQLVVTMPARISDMKNESSEIFTNFAFSQMDDQVVVVQPGSRDYTSIAKICGIGLNADKTLMLSGIPEFKTKCANTSDPRAGRVQFVIEAVQNKFDLGIWVALLGAFLGSGVVVNLIGLARRKRA